MIFDMKFALILLCLLCCGIINTEPIGSKAALSFLHTAERIPPQSLIPRRRVKRVRRDAFDHVPDRRQEFYNISERTKERFGVIDSAEQQNNDS